MKVVIDTNILLISLPSQSPYHEIIKAFNQKLYQLIITTAIFLEYEEILSERANSFVANNVLGAFLEASNAISVNTYYNWNLITVDPGRQQVFRCIYKRKCRLSCNSRFSF